MSLRDLNGDRVASQRNKLEFFINYFAIDSNENPGNPGIKVTDRIFQRAWFSRNYCPLISLINGLHPRVLRSISLHIINLQFNLPTLRLIKYTGTGV